MKTTKVILVAVMMVFATIGFAQNESAANELTSVAELPSHISVRTAMHIPGLLLAMRAQLTPGFLAVDQPIYTVTVKYNHGVYYIYGTYNAWKHFFSIKQYPKLKLG